MMRWASIVLIIVTLGCSRTIERVPEPENLIPRDKMVQVLKEMMKLEAHVQAQYGQVTTYYKVMRQSGDSLLGTFNLDHKTFESSMDYYGSRQTEMQEIYSETLEQLNAELGALQAK